MAFPYRERYFFLVLKLNFAEIIFKLEFAEAFLKLNFAAVVTEAVISWLERTRQSPHFNHEFAEILLKLNFAVRQSQSLNHIFGAARGDG
jgi:hypothetical protein